jgi:hypothetical protein
MDLFKGFSSAEDMLELIRRLIKITTGSQGFDIFLGGNRNSGSNRDCRRIEKNPIN